MMILRHQTNLGSEKSHLAYPDTKNLLVSGTPPLVDTTSDNSNNSPETSTIVYGDAAYGSRVNINACENVEAVSDKINVTPRSKGSGAAWGRSVRDPLGGSTGATRLDLSSREAKRGNQVYWKARIGYNIRWVVEAVFSIFKRVFGEDVVARKWHSIVQEVQLKVALFNKWRDESLARELESI